jgi:hypothetical protein
MFGGTAVPALKRVESSSTNLRTISRVATGKRVVDDGRSEMAFDARSCVPMKAAVVARAPKLVMSAMTDACSRAAEMGSSGSLAAGLEGVASTHSERCVDGKSVSLSARSELIEVDGRGGASGSEATEEGLDVPGTVIKLCRTRGARSCAGGIEGAGMTLGPCCVSPEAAWKC